MKNSQDDDKRLAVDDLTQTAIEGKPSPSTLDRIHFANQQLKHFQAREGWEGLSALGSQVYARRLLKDVSPKDIDAAQLPKKEAEALKQCLGRLDQTKLDQAIEKEAGKAHAPKTAYLSLSKANEGVAIARAKYAQAFSDLTADLNQEIRERQGDFDPSVTLPAIRAKAELASALRAREELANHLGTNDPAKEKLFREHSGIDSVYLNRDFERD